MPVDDQPYTGSEVKPDVEVIVNGKHVSDDNYTVTYSNNIEVGTATVKVTGKNNLANSVTKTFNIVSYDLSDAVITGYKDSYVYTGDRIMPALTVKLKGKTLKEKTEYIGCVNAGTTIVHVKGKGIYTGQKEFTYDILPIDLGETVMSNVSSSYTYSGSAIKPEPKVKWNDTILTNRADYKLTYANNVNAGTASVTITGNRNFTGTREINFTIAKKDISSAVINGIEESYPYTGSAILPVPTSVTIGTKTLTPETDYYVYHRSFTFVGTGYVYAMGIGNYTGIAKLGYNIAKRIILQTKMAMLLKKIRLTLVSPLRRHLKKNVSR